LIEQIEDHIAYTCECGSVHFNLLKSGKIECAKCGKQFGKWEQKDAVYCGIQQALNDFKKLDSE